MDSHPTKKEAVGNTNIWTTHYSTEITMQDPSPYKRISVNVSHPEYDGRLRYNINKELFYAYSVIKQKSTPKANVFGILSNSIRLTCKEFELNGFDSGYAGSDPRESLTRQQRANIVLHYMEFDFLNDMNVCKRMCEADGIYLDLSPLSNYSSIFREYKQELKEREKKK